MVRLLENREKYLLDISGGGKPPQWSGGFFSPGDAISRFYISGTGDMRQTVSHELTHHWLERRRLRGGEQTWKQPGNWIVEGFARFVEHQSMQFQKGKFGFNNDLNESVGMCMALRKGGGRMPLFNCPELVDISKEEFEQKLTQDQNRLHLFYQQSGALVYFMMNKRGPQGRKALVEYMRKFYAGELWIPEGKRDDRGLNKIDIDKGRPVKDGWKLLGFASGADLDAAFTAWLDALR